MEKVGSWSFIIGLVIAVLVGLFTEASGLVVTALVVLGLIIGFLNVTAKEAHAFLLASVALMATGFAGDFLATIPGIGNLLQRVVNNFVVLVAPAAIVVSVKALLGLAKD